MKLQLPTDHPRPPVQSFRGAVYSFSLSKEWSERLRRAVEQERSNLFDATVACFAALMRWYSARRICNRNGICWQSSCRASREAGERSDIPGDADAPAVRRCALREFVQGNL
jgi:hypothetical protein